MVRGMPLALLSLVLVSSATFAQFPDTPAAKYKFTIDPRTPAKDLLPPAPDSAGAKLPWLVADLTQVPEVQLQRAGDLGANQVAEERIAHQIAKINHVNKQTTDQFMRELCLHRPDLAGLPFAMDAQCRQSKDRGRAFFLEALVVRVAMGGLGGKKGDGNFPEMNFWQEYDTVQQDVARELAGNRGAIEKDRFRINRRELTPARVAALTQILAPESEGVLKEMVQRLAKIDSAESTTALAHLAVFAPSADVRQAAQKGLQGRPKEGYVEVLKHGLRYPWPAIARNAAQAIAQLEHKELVPWLVAQLDEPDPRAPVVGSINGQPAMVVREVVRINHHRNCLLCHAPGNTPDLQRNVNPKSPEDVVQDVVTAPVPLPGQPLPPPSQGYEPNGPSDILVRVDVTYLRQDFSMLQAVKEAKPWPEMQRFDFLVRIRAVTAEEIRSYRDWERQQRQEDAGYVPPNRRAALTALRALTGRDAPPTATAWKAVLSY